MTGETKQAPLWSYTFKSRPSEEEAAYREHFLDNDIRQMTISVIAISVIVIAFILLDIIQLSAQPELLASMLLKVVFLFLSIAVVVITNRRRLPSILDISALFYTMLYSFAIVYTYGTIDYSPTRITAVIALFIYTSHIVLPVYAVYLLPAMALLIVGESTLLFTTDRPDLIEDRALMLVAFLLAVFISIFASALQQQSRYTSFKALQEVKTLSGYLPICANCKKIRDDDGYYQQIETYISERSEAIFSHAICPVCMDELYGDVRRRRSKESA